MKPEDASERGLRRHALVKLIAIWRRLSWVAVESAVDVASRIRLTPEIMLRGTGHSFADQQVLGDGLLRSKAGKPLGKRQRSPIFAVIQAVRP